MPKRIKNTNPGYNDGVRGSVEVDIEARKADMARLVEEPDVEESETLPSGDAGDQVNPGSTDDEAPNRSDESRPRPDLGGTNIFSNLDALRLSDTDPASLTGAREILSHVPVRKPTRHEFFRVHPDPQMALESTIYVDKAERETFFVTPAMRGALLGETRPVLLTTAITTQRVVLIFPVNLPVDGRTNAWNDTTLEAVKLAKMGWIRMAADLRLGSYRVYKAEGELPDPEWPVQSFSELLEIAFRGRIVDTPNHAILRRLRGLT